MDVLPVPGLQHSQSKTKQWWRLSILLATLYTLLFCVNSVPNLGTRPRHDPAKLARIKARCQYIATEAGPPSNFHHRGQSDRFVPGTQATLITNAKIWTGNHNGTEVVHGDILLARGIIIASGHIQPSVVQSYSNVDVVDAHGAWVTPGIVDMHSHLGDAPSPELNGALDDNSEKGPIQAWLRSLDGLNTHDDSYHLSISGGVTTSLVLPGSANAIGGQAFVIKLRKTKERTPTSMLVEPPYTINNSFPYHDTPPRWRHLKQACGENPSDVYSMTRMDTMWAFREAYNKARQIKEAQDNFCARVSDGYYQDLDKFPDNLQWEALVDVLRGKVKVHTHCYEAVDLDDLMRLSNEFKFPIAAVHHASEAYLVPDVLRRGYGHPPAVALFATDARYKREAWRSSEFAPRILAEYGFNVAMKSDHPVQNSRYVLYEAQQAFYYGLPENLALSSVISTPAHILGLDHRIGFIRENWDADLVIWDSHPLALGATPSQVFIDGIPQLKLAHFVSKPAAFQVVPKVPNFDKEAAAAVQYEGLPPLEPAKSLSPYVLFVNVQSLLYRDESDIHEISLLSDEGSGVVVVHNGVIQCSGTEERCAAALSDVSEPEIVDLMGGSISPGLVSFGSPLGTEEIASEPSTNDGVIYDNFRTKVPEIVGGDFALIRAADGLAFGTRNALLAYRAGVTSAITAPSHSGFYGGLSVEFSLSASHRLEAGAIIQEVAGVHVDVTHLNGGPSISTQIAALRRLLLDPVSSESGHWVREIGEGTIPLVVEVHSADIIATLIQLKREVEAVKGTRIPLTITGASEAHLLAEELGQAGVGVILNPARPFPANWEDRRILPGPPLTEHSAISKLQAHNVTVAIGVLESWDARNARFDLAWAALEAGGRMSYKQAIALASSNVEKLLVGSASSTWVPDLVATQGGGLLDLNSKVVAVISPRKQYVHLML
ncbi:carbohydrate esterase family 9 protein [Hygrophoropsis aurantiaca]|uniref:Carbohydrate esterase family 9 protein n=1 Tax=Hygrophoropsis aurantiaca TaxID=72124 RepID=A0ACB8AMW4_9AGAM|nr:carbohydrate esterase family 9 protein [Hygrophoropsis aurantiaca]